MYYSVLARPGIQSKLKLKLVKIQYDQIGGILNSPYFRDDIGYDKFSVDLFLLTIKDSLDTTLTLYLKSNFIL